MSKPLSPLAKKKIVIAALEDIKAHDIQAIDVRKLTALFDWIIVASADSARQTKALARHVRDSLKEAGSALVGSEGEDGGEWILVDAGDVVAHVMQPAVRQYYNLEELWSEGRFDKAVNSTAPAGSSPRPASSSPRRRPGPNAGKPGPKTRKPGSKARKPSTRSSSA